MDICRHPDLCTVVLMNIWFNWALENVLAKLLSTLGDEINFIVISLYVDELLVTRSNYELC